MCTRLSFHLLKFLTKAFFILGKALLQASTQHEKLSHRFMIYYVNLVLLIKRDHRLGVPVS